MSLSPQLNKLVHLIDQSLYEKGYLISNSKWGEREEEKEGECKCIETGRVREQKQGRGERQKKKTETEQLDCHVNSCADR